MPERDVLKSILLVASMVAQMHRHGYGVGVADVQLILHGTRNH